MIIDELASFVYQPGVPSMVGADRAMWDYNPIMVSSNITSNKAGYGRFYQSAVDDPSKIRQIEDSFTWHVGCPFEPMFANSVVPKGGHPTCFSQGVQPTYPYQPNAETHCETSRKG